MLAYTKFHARTGLAKSPFRSFKLIASTAINARRKVKPVARKPQNKIARCVIYKLSRGVFRIKIAAKTKLASNEVIETATGPGLTIVPHIDATKMIERFLAK